MNKQLTKKTLVIEKCLLGTSGVTNLHIISYSKLQLEDLLYFMVILMVFIVSFGVVFQALVDPNREPSLELLKNILWRGYWQTLGELFLNDVTEGMGNIRFFYFKNNYYFDVFMCSNILCNLH